MFNNSGDVYAFFCNFSSSSDAIYLWQLSFSFLGFQSEQEDQNFIFFIYCLFVSKLLFATWFFLIL
jgi:hypothetical protein